MRRWERHVRGSAQTVGYTLDQNFLSDLGMTVSYSGRPNTRGSTLFVASMGAMLWGFGGAVWESIRKYAEHPGGRRAAQAAGVATLLVCGLLVGVACTPENQMLEWHVWFTQWAFVIAPLVPGLLALAAVRTDGTARRAIAGWCTLSIVMVAYLLLLMFGPATTTEAGLRFMVLGQKLMTIAGSGVLVFLCVDQSPPSTSRTG